ncbi:MAG TPA: hypothetical protein VLD37_05630 [Candidatus Bilamarchaeum sp.]|nr:hypothetical protein [Candidatus Bilamarchaeum sp.]
MRKTVSRVPKFPVTAAAALAGFVMFSPMGERTAHAQEPPQGQVDGGAQVDTSARGDSTARAGARSDAPVSRTFSGVVTQDTEILSLISSERVMDTQLFPATIASVRVRAVDDTGVEFAVGLDAPADGTAPDSTFRVNYDGTKGGNVRIIAALGFENFTAERTEGGQARISFDYNELPVARRHSPGSGDRTMEFRRSDAVPGPYDDPVLSPYHDQVSIIGRRRHLELRSPFDIGGNVYSNEAGSSVYATARYAIRRPHSYVPLDLRLSAGNIWFGEQAAPFGSLYLRPAFQVWYLRGAYYGTVSVVGNMASTVYTSHSLGLGMSIPIDSHNRLRFGMVAGGAVSFPAYDDIYLNMVGGVSFEHDNFLVYGMVTTFMAAPSPIKSAYFMNYQPMFQNVDFGAQLRFMDDRMAVRLFGDISTLYQRGGARLSGTWITGRSGSMDAYVALGATHYIPILGDRVDPMVVAGISGTFDFGGITSTNTGRYEHMQRGAFRQAHPNIPTQSEPGPYGFGRSGNPLVDGDVNLAKDRIMHSGSYAEFVGSYRGASTSQLIMTARFMGAFMQQVAYANNAAEALNNVRQFDPEVRRIAGASHDDIFGFMQRYVDFYQNNPPGTPLPEDLRNGIAVCAGIHSTMANFLEANGIPTLVASVNTRHGPHVVAIAMPSGETDLLDYGNLYQTPANTPDEALRSYGMARQAPTFQSQLWRPGVGYLGTYETSEGRLLHRSLGLDNREILGTEYLGVR